MAETEEVPASLTRREFRGQRRADRLQNLEDQYANSAAKRANLVQEQVTNNSLKEARMDDRESKGSGLQTLKEIGASILPGAANAINAGANFVGAFDPAVALAQASGGGFKAYASGAAAGLPPGVPQGPVQPGPQSSSLDGVTDPIERYNISRNERDVQQARDVAAQLPVDPAAAQLAASTAQIDAGMMPQAVIPNNDNVPESFYSHKLTSLQAKIPGLSAKDVGQMRDIIKFLTTP
jgi:hypothetical protein